MPGRLKSIFLFGALVMALWPIRIPAHQPVIVKRASSYERPVAVTKPEISFAFYGQLDGGDHFYKIDWPKPFRLYVNILVPDFAPEQPPIPRHDMSFVVIKNGRVVHATDGLQTDWKRFYEKYGRDHYYLGPEYEASVESGVYLIRVFNSTNQGRYALAVGKKEKFTLFGIIGAMFKAWSLDRWFFKP